MNQFYNSFYFEQHGGSTLLASIVSKLKSNGNSLNEKILKKQFAEAILTRVTIVDERIQEIANKEKQNHSYQPRKWRNWTSYMVKKPLKKQEYGFCQKKKLT
ncbi:MAG: hypothetical protein IPK08_19765 [Bacteroidetes bacterium]|nr:hypothetical protein [Bacteroidota bacterium]